MKLTTLTLLSLLFAAPAIARAQVDDDALRLGGTFALGLGGDATGKLNTARFSEGLDPTIGFGARLEGAVWDYLSIGANLEVMTFEANVLDSEREAVFDMDLWVRVRYLIELSHDSLYLEPYVGVPIGFSVGVLQDIDGMGDEAWPGWNTGVLGGAYLLTSAGLGFFFEAGWRFHQLFTSGTIGIFDIDAQLETNQFMMQLGVVLIAQ